MQEEIKVWLEDIEKAITEIKDFLPEPKNFLEFQKDIKTKRAVERNIEIIRGSDEQNLEHRTRNCDKRFKENSGYPKLNNPWIRFCFG